MFAPLPLCLLCVGHPSSFQLTPGKMRNGLYLLLSCFLFQSLLFSRMFARCASRALFGTHSHFEYFQDMYIRRMFVYMYMYMCMYTYMYMYMCVCVCVCVCVCFGVFFQC